LILHGNVEAARGARNSRVTRAYAFQVFLLRMLTAKNSQKRARAPLPSASMSAGVRDEDIGNHGSFGGRLEASDPA
jgi:hypothetical protein